MYLLSEVFNITLHYDLYFLFHWLEGNDFKLVHPGTRSCEGSLGGPCSLSQCIFLASVLTVSYMTALRPHQQASLPTLLRPFALFTVSFSSAVSFLSVPFSPIQIPYPIGRECRHHPAPCSQNTTAHSRAS